VDRVSRDVRVSISEVDVDNNEIVDVIELFPDLPFCDLACYSAHDEISRSTSSDLVRDVRWHMELTISPAKLKLQLISI
jgi:hypothetical protein